MSDPVLHIHDPDGKIDGFMVANMFRVSRGVSDVVVHIDRVDRSVDCFRVNREGSTEVMVAQAGKCGCP